MRIEIFKTRRQLLVRKPTFKTRYYFRIVAANGEVIAQSEAYTQKHNAVDVVRRYFPPLQWEVKDLT